ncbi:MAG: prolipoprotein diacylglyceryl transferase family protein [Candidatus Omnitrophota bacterium]
MINELFYNTPFSMSSWYFFVLVGMIFAVTLSVIKTPRENFPITRWGVLACSLLMIYGGMVGGKLLYIALNREELAQFGDIPLNSLLATAGYSSLGAFAFYILTIFLFAKLRKKRISFLTLADYGMPFTFLVQAFVRVGCFLNGCCYGKPTGLPWGVIFPGETTVPVHPAQIYSMLYLVFIFVAMRFIYKKGPFVGTTFFGSIFLYSIFRFFNEYLRVDSFPVWGALTLAQVTMGVIFCISGVSLIIVLLTRRNP